MRELLSHSLRIGVIKAAKPPLASPSKQHVLSEGSHRAPLNSLCSASFSFCRDAPSASAVIDMYGCKVMPEPEGWHQVHVEQPSTGATLAACFHSVKTQYCHHLALSMHLDAAALLQRKLPLSARPRCLHDKTHSCKLSHAPQRKRC